MYREDLPFLLNRDPIFPPPELATKSGLLAVGGDLSTERLIEAYRNGIFPWFSEGAPLQWWAPDPRFVLFPKHLKVSKSMKQVLNRQIFTITFNRAFEAVISACAGPRSGQPGTWITEDMIKAYTELHRLGSAHSVEAWKDGKLCGGLYGIALGKCFFGESMFSRESNASKAALITMVKSLEEYGLELVDCQVHTPHLESLGACFINRDDFMRIVLKNRGLETISFSMPAREHSSFGPSLNAH